MSRSVLITIPLPIPSPSPSFDPSQFSLYYPELVDSFWQEGTRKFFNLVSKISEYSAEKGSDAISFQTAIIALHFALPH